MVLFVYENNSLDDLWAVGKWKTFSREKCTMNLQQEAHYIRESNLQTIKIKKKNGNKGKLNLHVKKKNPENSRKIKWNNIKIHIKWIWAETKHNIYQKKHNINMQNWIRFLFYNRKVFHMKLSTFDLDLFKKGCTLQNKTKKEHYLNMGNNIKFHKLFKLKW